MQTKTASNRKCYLSTGWNSFLMNNVGKQLYKLQKYITYLNVFTNVQEKSLVADLPCKVPRTLQTSSPSSWITTQCHVCQRNVITDDFIKETLFQNLFETNQKSLSKNYLVSSLLVKSRLMNADAK